MARNTAPQTHCFYLWLFDEEGKNRTQSTVPMKVRGFPHINTYLLSLPTLVPGMSFAHGQTSKDGDCRYMNDELITKCQGDSADFYSRL